MNLIPDPSGIPIDPNLEIDISPCTIPKLEDGGYDWSRISAIKTEPASYDQVSGHIPGHSLTAAQGIQATSTPSTIPTNGLEVTSPNTLTKFIAALRESGRIKGAFGVGQLEEVLGDCLSVPEQPKSSNSNIYPDICLPTDGYTPNAYSSFEIDSALEERLDRFLYSENRLPFETTVEDLNVSGAQFQATALTENKDYNYPTIPTNGHGLYADESQLPSVTPSFLNNSGFWYENRGKESANTPAAIPLHHQTIPRLSMPTPRTHQPGNPYNQDLTAAPEAWGRNRPKRAKCDPMLIYPNMPTPNPWGPILEDGRLLFRYEDDGPLDTSLVFDRPQLETFVNECPRNLTIWVQQAPAQCNYRLGRGESRCRYLHCPDPKRTILPGWLRVAMDEYPELTATGAKDPFKMSLVLHLWCFEKCFDPMEFYMRGKLGADQRELPKEIRNSMAINKDTDALIVSRAFDPWFIKNHSEWHLHGPKTDPREYKDSLSAALVNYHLSNQIQSRQKTRNSRNRTKLRSNLITIDIHKGDLDMYISHRQKRTGIQPRIMPNENQPNLTSTSSSMQPTTSNFSSQQGFPSLEVPMATQESFGLDPSMMFTLPMTMNNGMVYTQDGTQNANGVQPVKPASGSRYPKRRRL